MADIEYVQLVSTFRGDTRDICAGADTYTYQSERQFKVLCYHFYFFRFCSDLRGRMLIL